MNRKIGFGIIGCGAISKFHINAILSIQEAGLVGVYDPNTASMERVAEEYHTHAFASQEQLLLCAEIDVVCVLTPSGLHASIAMEVLKAGKHVVVEKPMALNLTDAEALIRLSEEKDLKVCVISQLRFSPAIQAVRRALQDGMLGNVVSASLSMKYFRDASYYTSSGWRGTWKMDGGGALMNQGIHGIDLLYYLAGPVRQLKAICKTQTRPIETEDSAVAILEFENGAVGTLEGSTTCYPGYPRRLEICGDKGSILLEEDHIVRWDLPSPPASCHISAQPKPAEHGASNPTAISADGHIRQLRNMVHSILYGEPLLVNAKEGRKPLEIILAIYESSKTNASISLSDQRKDLL